MKAQTVAETDNYTAYYNNISWMERLSVAAYLNSVAFNYLPDAPACIDKTQFKVKPGVY